MPQAENSRSLRPLLALVAVTGVWGLTFVQVKDAVAVYPVFAFLTLRFGIATLALAPPSLARVRSIGRQGGGAAIFCTGVIWANALAAKASTAANSAASIGTTGRDILHSMESSAWNFELLL